MASGGSKRLNPFGVQRVVRDSRSGRGSKGKQRSAGVEPFWGSKGSKGQQRALGGIKGQHGSAGGVPSGDVCAESLDASGNPGDLPLYHPIYHSHLEGVAASLDPQPHLTTTKVIRAKISKTRQDSANTVDGQSFRGILG
jgi:hypothetical protein